MTALNGDEWGTPKWMIDAAIDVLGRIDLDPFSSAWHNRRVGAAMWLDRKRDGLRTPWSGPTGPSRVWCNPPFSRGLIQPCVQRWIDAAYSGSMLAGIILTNVDPSTRWCQALLEYPHCMLAKRVAFHHPALSVGGAVRGNRSAQMVTYAGPRYPDFRRVFGALGSCR